MVTDEKVWLLLSDSCKYGTYVYRNQGFTRFFSLFVGVRVNKKSLRKTCRLVNFPNLFFASFDNVEKSRDAALRGCRCALTALHIVCFIVSLYDLYDTDVFNTSNLHVQYSTAYVATDRGQ